MCYNKIKYCFVLIGAILEINFFEYELPMDVG